MNVLQRRCVNGRRCSGASAGMGQGSACQNTVRRCLVGRLLSGNKQITTTSMSAAQWGNGQRWVPWMEMHWRSSCRPQCRLPQKGGATEPALRARPGILIFTTGVGRQPRPLWVGSKWGFEQGSHLSLQNKETPSSLTAWMDGKSVLGG